VGSARTYRWIACAHLLYTFASAGILGWLPGFFMRSHGMSVKAAGAFFGNLLRIWRRRWIDSRWLDHRESDALPPLPLYVSAIAVSSLWLSLASMTLFGALIGGGGAPLCCCCLR
jgi:hypothetical protein